MRQPTSPPATVSHARQSGSVVLELAIFLPILVVLFIGVADLGSLLGDHQVLESAAREGARFSALPGNQIGSSNPGVTDDVIKQRVIDYLAPNGIVISAADVTVSQDTPLTAGTLTIFGSQVQVNYTRPVLIPYPPIMPTTITLNATAVFRNFY